MQHHTDVLDEECWDIVWHAPVQQRIRAFLWLACHDRVLGNSNLFKRRLTDDPKCYICGAADETTLHIIRDCPAARVVWRKVVDDSIAHKFYQGNVKEWIAENAKEDSIEGKESWATFFGIAVWWIWRWRNCFVYNRRDELPIDFGAFLQVRYDEARRAIWDANKDQTSNTRYKVPANITWHAPDYGWYVLNCDGSAKGCPGPAGGGGIIRDNAGNLITSFAASFGYCTAFRAEVLALVRGLEMAQNLQIAKLEVQLDNLACVQALKTQKVAYGENIHDINQCLRLLNDDRWQVKVAHIFREGNRAADWLANRGVIQDSQLVFCKNNVPGELSRILEEDIRGVAMPRLIPP